MEQPQNVNERIKFSDKTLQRKFLQFFQLGKKLSLAELASHLGVPVSTLKGWLSGAKTLPKPIFDSICKQMPRLKTFRCMAMVLPSNWGQIKGGKIRIAEEKNVHELTRAARKAKEISRLNRKIRAKAENTLVTSLLMENVDLKSILAICLLTDGSLDRVSDGSYRISFFSTDEALKDTVSVMLFKLSKYVPVVHKGPDGVYSVRVSDLDIARELLKLSPSYKKSPSQHQSNTQYLKEKQPSVAFLNTCNKQTQVWGIRFAFSADGSISVSKKGGIELTLSCAHPKLCYEWKALLEKFGLKGKMGKSKDSWSGIYGLRFYGAKSASTFLQMGGFVPRTKVTKNSKRYRGIEKNELLRLACRAKPVGPYLVRQEAD